MTTKLSLDQITLRPLCPEALLKKERGVWVYQGEATQVSIPDLIDRERRKRLRLRRQGEGQITPLTILHQIAEVLPHRAAVGQIVVPCQIRIEPRRLRLPGIEYLPLQWL